MMGLHPLEDVIEHAHGGDDVRPLVEHDACGSMAHGRVSDLSTRSDSMFGEGLEHLGRPTC